PGLLGKGMSVAGQFAPRALSAPIAGALYKRLGN
ncbi:short-chain dehydrogenase, partial [Nocardia aurea]